jgi:hypothetical protein
LRYRNTKGDENMSGDFGFDDTKTLSAMGEVEAGETEVAKRRRAIANIRSHEWAYIKTRETDRKNKVVISRCMHCKCERRKLHGGTGASFYSIPGEEQPVQACQPCTLETTESKPKGDDK